MSDDPKTVGRFDSCVGPDGKPFSAQRYSLISWKQGYRAGLAALESALSAAPPSDDYRRGLEDAAKDVLAERERQKAVEGWTPEHDDRHTDRELARAAAVYALHAAQPPNIIFSPELQEEIPENWPWSNCYFKPRGPRRDLVRAGALILAEIERIDRAAIRAAGEDQNNA